MKKPTFCYFTVAFLVVSCFIGLYTPQVKAITNITYNSGTDTIIVTGYTPENPCTFTDIYNADVMGGWGQVTMQGTNQIVFNCKLVVGDGTTQTYVADANKQLTWTATSVPAWNAIVEVKSNGTLTLGILTDSTTKATSSGCSIISNINDYVYFRCTPNSTGIINCYSSTFASTATGAAYYFFIRDWQGKCYNTIFARKCVLYRPSNLDCYRLTFQDNTITEAIREPSGSTFTDVLFSGYTNQLTQAGTETAIFYGFKNLDNEYAVVGADDTGTPDIYYINCEFPTWAFWFTTGWTAYRQYTFDLTVLNGEISDFVEEANVTLKKNDVVLFTLLTNSTGQIPTQTVTYCYYDKTHGNSPQDGQYPFVLTITHPEWPTYTSRFYVTEKTNLIISMQENDTIQYLVVALILGAVVGGVVVALLSSKR